MTSSEQGGEIYAQQGFGGTAGFGQSPALVIVDFVNGFLDPEIFGGGNIATAAQQTIPLLAAARKAQWPIALTRIAFADDGSDANIFTRKVPSLRRLTETNPASQLATDFAPLPGELVVSKRLPSAFQGTPLGPWLTQRRIDTVVIAGATTSGCIRATALDAMGLGFVPVVVADCVGDRAPGPHDANLFDIQAKIGEVVPLAKLFSIYNLQ